MDTIHESIFSGSVDQFQAVMKRLIKENTGKWLVPNIVIRERDTTTPCFRSWIITWKDKEDEKFGIAGIEAYEEGMSKTRIHFIDGYWPGAARPVRPPIGPPFAEFCEMVVKEAGLKPEETAAEDRKRGARGDTLTRVKHALELVEDGMSVTKACKEAGTDTRTYKRWEWTVKEYTGRFDDFS